MSSSPKTSNVLYLAAFFAGALLIVNVFLVSPSRRMKALREELAEVQDQVAQAEAELDSLQHQRAEVPRDKEPPNGASPSPIELLTKRLGPQGLVRGCRVWLLAVTLVLAGVLAGCRGGGEEGDYTGQEEVAGGQEEPTGEERGTAGQSIWKWDGDTRSLRNPFEKPSWVRRRAAPREPARVEKVERPRATRLHLQGILYSQGDSRALINGRWLRVGDRIQGLKVVKIDRTSVLLRKRNGSLIALSLGNRR